MRIDFKVFGNYCLRRQKPSRQLASLKTVASILGIVFIATLMPSIAEAKSSPRIWISRIDGKFVVQGHKFAPKSTALVKAGIAGMSREKNLFTNAKGYFWATFEDYGSNFYGNAWARAWVDKRQHRVTSTYLKPATKPQTKTTTTTSSSSTTSSTSTTTTTNPTGSKKPTTTSTSTSTSSTTKPPSNPQTPSNWNLIVQDDFNGNSLNSAMWGVYEGVGNEGVGWRKRSAVSVGNGALHITGRGDVAGGLALRQSQLYGRYEIRSRLDKGAGYNTATLLWPSSERWPIDVEIDISEIFHGAYNKSGSFLHYGSPHKRFSHFEENIDTSQWHTYAVDWEPNKITYYLDGRVIFTVVEPSAIPHTRHFLAMQLDVSRSTDRIDGTTFHIDWIKVYQRS